MFFLPFWFGSYGYAQSDTLINKSLLWKIEHDSLTTTSYLFGTIHIPDKRVFVFSDSMLFAFNAVEAFAMEINPDEISIIKSLRATKMKDTTLKDLLNEEELIFLDNKLKEKLNLGVGFFNSIKPFFTMSQYSLSVITNDMEKPLDMFLYERAKFHNKIIFGIETFEEQIELVDNIPLRDQCDLLMETVRNESIAIETEELIQAYIAQDLPKIQGFIENETNINNFQEIFITNRNYKMAERISLMCKKNSVFFAIGAGHLAGNEGVIQLLINKGFKVTPVLQPTQ